MEKPREINLAVNLMLITFLLGVARVSLMYLDPSQAKKFALINQNQATFVWYMTFNIFIYFYLMRKIGDGVGWARYLLILDMILKLNKVKDVMGVLHDKGLIVFIITILQYAAVYTTGYILLFNPRAKLYFKRKEIDPY